MEINRPISERVRDIIADFLNVPPSELTPDRRLEDFNVDSLDFIEILFLIDEKTELSLPGDPTDLRREIRTLADIYRIAEACETKQGASRGGRENTSRASGMPRSPKPVTET
jgi:acyl carrier protein